VLFAMAELSYLIKGWHADVSSLTNIVDDFYAASESDIAGPPRAAGPVGDEYDGRLHRQRFCPYGRTLWHSRRASSVVEVGRRDCNVVGASH